MLELYIKNNVSKDYTSVGLFRAVQEKYSVKRGIYPGCYVHITPSLIFSEVIYVDSFKNTHKFYESSEVADFVEKNKEYSDVAVYRFYQQDYNKDIPEELESFDMIVSQYGGFGGQAMKKYLKKGGILVCNNSHGDASMASFDDDYKLIAVYTRKADDHFAISEKNLERYLIPKKIGGASKAQVEKTMRGIAYTASPSGYIFEKVN